MWLLLILLELRSIVRQAADTALAVFEEWMDSQRLSRNAQAPDKQKELAKLTIQAKVWTGTHGS